MKNANAILVVDDDDVFCQVMGRALTRRGFEVTTCFDIDTAVSEANRRVYKSALVDLKINQESGLKLIRILKGIQPKMEIIMLTGYASVATAVEAIKLGALNYLCKPVFVGDVLKALKSTDVASESPTPISTPSLDRVTWEYIQKTLQDHEGNISAAARALGVHRRTLQRKLKKRPQTP